MKIETVEPASLPLNGGGRRAGGRDTAASNAQQLRNRKRRLMELNSENYRDVKIDIPAAYLKGGPKAGKSVNSRRILASKKSFANHVDDNPRTHQKWLDAGALKSRYPPRQKCTICGYFSTATCTKCAAKYCSLACKNTHDETRCQK